MAGDNIAGQIAFLEGDEIVNANRTTAYLKAGYGPENINVLHGCDCPEELVITLIGEDCAPATGSAPVTGCEHPENDGVGYNSPSSDPAPWYDPDCPESAHFAGFYPVEFDGIGSTYTREVFPVIGGGGILGRLRAAPRTLTWRGFLFGSTCCGVAYGLRWLTAKLSQTRCGAECSGEQLDMMICCPQKEIEDAIAREAAKAAQIAAEAGDVSSFYGGFAYGTAEYGDSSGSGLTTPLTDSQVIASFSDTAFRSFFNVGLIEGPLVLSERQSSCGCGCSTIMEIEFSLVAGNPHMYRNPIVLADCETWEDEIALIMSCPWVESDDPADCAEEECPDPTPCTDDPNCPSPTLPVIVTTIDECVCEPISPVEKCVGIPASKCTTQSVPIFQVFSGSQPLYSTRIRVLENPIGLTCETIAMDPCLSCATIGIRFIPANSTLTIDGVNRRITIECPGGETRPGEPFLTTGFTWPVFECFDYCVCFEVDALTVASDACFSVSVVPREM